MRNFVNLYIENDQLTDHADKVRSFEKYFNTVNEADIVWAISLYLQKSPKRITTAAKLKEWSAEISDIPHWLFEESLKIVGDQAETVALILPNPTSPSDKTISARMQDILSLREHSETAIKASIFEAWKSLDQEERFVFNKIVTGSFRMKGYSKIIVEALAKHTGQEEPSLMHRMLEDWNPADISYKELVLDQSENEDLSKPYPFFKAYYLETELEKLGIPSDWLAEWKWDGIRGQLIIRNNQVFLWTHDMHLVTDKFPEFLTLGECMESNVVLDGEILAFKDGAPQSFSRVKTRVDRKKAVKKDMVENPVIFLAYDLLEIDNKDIRSESQIKRRDQLAKVVQSAQSESFLLSEKISFQTWENLSDIWTQSRENHALGLILKRKDATYKEGRIVGDWWKWKAGNLTTLAVLLYAQRGRGPQARSYVEYTFAVWEGDLLVPFTKTKVSLEEEEQQEIAAWIKENTKERFGPVRSLKAELVFEIAYEGVEASTRHKSGVVVRNPSVLCWHREMNIEEVGSLSDVKRRIVK